MPATTPNPGPYDLGPFQEIVAIQWGAGAPPVLPPCDNNYTVTIAIDEILVGADAHAVGIDDALCTLGNLPIYLDEPAARGWRMRITITDPAAGSIPINYTRNADIRQGNEKLRINQFLTDTQPNTTCQENAYTDLTYSPPGTEVDPPNNPDTLLYEYLSRIPDTSVEGPTPSVYTLDLFYVTGWPGYTNTWIPSFIAGAAQIEYWTVRVEVSEFAGFATVKDDAACTITEFVSMPGVTQRKVTFTPQHSGIPFDIILARYLIYRQVSDSAVYDPQDHLAVATNTCVASSPVASNLFWGGGNAPGPSAGTTVHEHLLRDLRSGNSRLEVWEHDGLGFPNTEHPSTFTHLTDAQVIDCSTLGSVVISSISTEPSRSWTHFPPPNCSMAQDVVAPLGYVQWVIFGYVDVADYEQAMSAVYTGLTSGVEFRPADYGMTLSCAPPTQPINSDRLYVDNAGVDLGAGKWIHPLNAVSFEGATPGLPSSIHWYWNTGYVTPPAFLQGETLVLTL